jgi:hypothetical protein
MEAESYLNLDFMTFYYVMTEVNYMIDSRAKNMMLCSFDVDPNQPVYITKTIPNSGIPKDYEQDPGDTTLMRKQIGTGTGHWFPIFYDMDTQLGIDNEGKIRFLYDDEDYEFGKFNTLANYNNLITGEDNGGVVNILWANFSIGF